jgi:methylmalonyl-CoA/ethylmalonyl-CoA epimerase
MKFHHVGIATADLGRAVAEFERLHPIRYKSEPVFDPLQNAHLQYLQTEDGVFIEFVSGPAVESFLEKGIRYYHLCYEVDDLDGAVQRMRGQGCLVVSEPKPAILFRNRRVAFLYAPYGLIELLESGAP